MQDDAGPVPSPYLVTGQESGIGVFHWNPLSTELSWDDTMAQIFVADRPGERPFETWVRRVHPDDQERVLATFSQFSTAEATYRIVLDDGSIRHVLSRVTQVQRGADGEPTGVQGVLLDITAAQQTAAQLIATLDSISDGFIALDHQYNFTYLNRRGQELLGMSFESLRGRSIWEAFPHALGTNFEAAYRKVMQERVPVVFVEHYPEPLNIWVEVRAEPSDHGIVIYFQDITVRRAQEEERDRLLRSEQIARHAAEKARLELVHQGAHDPLTGLLNRQEFEALAGQHLRESTEPVTALFLDLDRFKRVNDSLGHAAGDAVLVHAASRLRGVLREGDIAARHGGDEFVVLLTGNAPREAEIVAERILIRMREPVEIGTSTICITVSIGLASAHQPDSVSTLLHNADAALYRAKDAGRDRLAWFDPAAHQ